MRHHVRKNSEPFTNSLSRNMSMNEKTLSNLGPDSESSKTVCEPAIFRTSRLAIFNPMQTVISCLYFHMQSSSPLSMLVRAVLLDKKAEEVPSVSRNVHGSVYILGNSLVNLSDPFFWVGSTKERYLLFEHININYWFFALLSPLHYLLQIFGRFNFCCLGLIFTKLFLGWLQQLIESVLTKVMEEFEQRIANQVEVVCLLSSVFPSFQ